MEQDLWLDHCPFLQFGTEEGACHPVFAKLKEIRPECKIGLEPGRPKGGCWREEEGLCDHRDLHEVAEVDHEEVVVDRAVRRVSQQHQQCQRDLHQVFLDGFEI